MFEIIIAAGAGAVAAWSGILLWSHLSGSPAAYERNRIITRSPARAALGRIAAPKDIAPAYYVARGLEIKRDSNGKIIVHKQAQLSKEAVQEVLR